MTIIIPLTKGYVAIVDDCDADLAEYKWASLFSGQNVYAICARKINGKGVSLLMHRLILERMLDRKLKRSEHTDHKKGGGLNNVRSNLRLATCQQNIRNKEKSSNGTGLYKGIAFYKSRGKWGGFIRADEKSIFLGSHINPLEAHRAYCIAALTHFGEFANFGANSPFLGWTLADFERGYQQPTQLPLPLPNAA